MLTLDAFYLFLLSLLPIPFHTGDLDLDVQLYAMVIEAEEREYRKGRCILPVSYERDILITLVLDQPYKPMPLKDKVKRPKYGRDLV